MTSCTPDSTVVLTCSYLYLKPGSIRFKIDRLRADFKSSRSSRFLVLATKESQPEKTWNVRRLPLLWLSGSQGMPRQLTDRWHPHASAMWGEKRGGGQPMDLDPGCLHLKKPRSTPTRSHIFYLFHPISDVWRRRLRRLWMLEMSAMSAMSAFQPDSHSIALSMVPESEATNLDPGKLFRICVELGALLHRFCLHFLNVLKLAGTAGTSKSWSRLWYWWCYWVPATCLPKTAT